MTTPEQISLGSVGFTYGGLTGKSGNDFGRGWGRYVTFMEVLEGARLSGHSLGRVDVGNGERQYEVKYGDVLFNGSSETPEEVAMGAVVDFDVPSGVYLNSFCFGYRISRAGVVEPTYLAYFFRSSVGRHIVLSLAQGATRYNIAKTKLMQVPLTLPNYVEQKKVALALSDADDLIASLERLIAKKRAIKQGMMQELLTGRTRLPGFDETWRETRLGEVLQFQPGFPFSSQFFSDASSGPRLVRNRDLRADDAIVYYAGPYTKEYVVKKGDVLIGMDGDFSPKVWNSSGCLLNQRVGRLIVGDQASRSYLAHALVSPLKEIEGDTGATTVKHLTHRDVENIVMTLPYRSEQDAIANALDNADAEIEALQRRLEATRAIKQGMMQELLTGRTRLPVEE